MVLPTVATVNTNVSAANGRSANTAAARASVSGEDAGAMVVWGSPRRRARRTGDDDDVRFFWGKKRAPERRRAV